MLVLGRVLDAAAVALGLLDLGLSACDQGLDGVGHVVRLARLLGRRVVVDRAGVEEQLLGERRLSRVRVGDDRERATPGDFGFQRGI